MRAQTQAALDQFQATQDLIQATRDQVQATQDQMSAHIEQSRAHDVAWESLMAQHQALRALVQSLDTDEGKDTDEGEPQS